MSPFYSSLGGETDMDENKTTSNDVVIDSEYAYIQTFINFLKQIVEIFKDILNSLFKLGKEAE